MPRRINTAPIWTGVSTRETALGIAARRLDVEGDGRGLKETLAGVGLHVGAELLAR